MRSLTAADLLAIHASVIDATGGEGGLINPAALESCVLRPLTAFGGAEMYPGLIDKVAVLIHSINAFHPFVDGNKRVSVVAADVCLRLNGVRLVPSAEVEAFFWSIARGEQSVESIREWLPRNTRPLADD